MASPSHPQLAAGAPAIAAPAATASTATATAASAAVQPTFTLRAAPIGMRRSSSVSGRPLGLGSLPSSPAVFKSDKEPAANAQGHGQSPDDDSSAAASLSSGGPSASNSMMDVVGSVSTSSVSTAASVSVSASADKMAADISRLNLDSGAIDPRDLAALLTTAGARVVVLDMRSFVMHNQAHIKDSINVCVPTTLLRRGEFNVALMEKGISKAADRERLRARAGAEVILYDETTESTYQNSTLVKAYHALRQDGVAASVRWLDGGMATFQKEYVDHCKICCSIASKLFRRIDMSLACSAPKTASSLTASGPNEPVQILSYLFLGGEKVASDEAMLHSYGIKYVLNAAVECDDNFPSQFVYLRLDLMDTPSQSNMIQIFDQAFKFIDLARDSNERVLVHCRAGQSRSVTVVLAYLMRTLGWTLTRAYSYVQRRRPTMSPNLGFMGHLTQYESVLRHVGNVGVCISGALSLPTAAFPPTATAALNHLPASVPIAMARKPFTVQDIAQAASAWTVYGQAWSAPALAANTERGSAAKLSNPFETAMATAHDS